MYRNTRFGELLKGLPRGRFEKIVQHFQADKYSKGFRCWDQLVAMVYGQLSGARSLRELEAGFNTQDSHHYHLGTRKIKRSTLSDANSKRDVRVFEATCSQLLKQAHRKVRNELNEMLYLLDSTPISLQGHAYDTWCKENRTRRTQGLKVHIMTAPEAELPVYLDITAPNVNDLTAGQEINIEPDATYVFDKGYCDYNWWHQFSVKGALFVTRFKKNAGVKVISETTIAQSNSTQILSDEIVMFKNRRPGGSRINHHYETPLRRVSVHRDGKTPLILATNDMKRSPIEIAALYKKRWDIELFFKWLKQNLKIKQFLGRSENAVKIQIYIAIITYLLTSLARSKSGVNITLRMYIAGLKASMFQQPYAEQQASRRRREKIEHSLSLQGCLAL